MCRLLSASGIAISACIFAAACGTGAGNPVAPTSRVAAPNGLQNAEENHSWGPETPPFNIEAQLRGEGFGLVKFRQPNDQNQVVYLDVWVRDLRPNTSYSLQRATDLVPDDNCTGTNWLTLGKGPAPEPLLTEDQGTGRAELWRDLSAFAAGSAFDIHFRVIQNGTNPLVVPLQSDCYQFVISQ